MRIIFVAIAGYAILLAGCASQPDFRAETAPPETVASVDLDRYAGLWYEIARYPNSFQKNCEAVTADYKRRDDGKITVVNTCGAGDVRMAEGVARVVDGSNGAKLKVQFAPEWVPFAAGDYWVLYLESDYSAALVGDPDGKYLWILGRSARIPETQLFKIKKRAMALGYDIEPLKMTDHSGG